MGINANVTNSQITATVGETQIDVAVSGGVGPTGSSGTIAVSAPLTNAGTTTAANLGLSVGTGLAVSGGSLVVSYGTSSTVACRGDDARLSDSREWSASTVTQAEAEAGSSTTRRAFTPQRVFQAIAAWWAASASKTKLDGIAAGATANATDAQLRDRSTHTGTQTASTISDFTSAVIAAAPPTTNASLLTSGTLPDARLSSNIARTSDVSSAVAAVVNAAPATLDTLKELADALGSDANFSTTVTNALAAKAPIASPTFTGTVSGITKSMVGLGNVDNTSDADKPISTAVQAALNNFVSVEVFDDLSAVVFNHAHGNITNAGAIGSTSGQIVVTTTSGVLTTAASLGWSLISSTPTTLSGYGITDAVASNDSRLTDARTPTAHKSSHATGGTDALSPADIGAATAAHSHLLSSITDAGTAASRNAPATGNAASAEVVLGSDTRLSDARTPLFHTHSASDLTATGTPSASTFLRGDGAWASAGSTSASDLTSGTLANARLTTRQRASTNLYLWSSFR